MRDPTPQTIQLRDYAPPAFLIPSVALDIALFDDHARVEARLRLQRNPAHPDPAAPLVLDGEDLELISVTLDGQTLYPDEYRLDEGRLTLPRVPDAFDLTTVCKLRPHENTRLMGLYTSKDGYFTQCEAEGFRRITFFLDRPDVMSRYATTIHADKTRYPWLLSNGNPVDYGDEDYGRHWMRWEDPFPKPCYLFAMVAANLEKLEEPFITGSGRLVSLQVYVEPGRLDQAGFALQALKKAMRWDEERFGLELDLDQYMIVAVGDFNMGAMENKGLNIFNTKYVLARQDTATDADFQAIDRVVAHEYFHNWTGNRVTCRDWFQLSLKEGLTVFRDQEFGAETYTPPVVRIQDVRRLRAAQFPEDAGPMAHPVRPQSYVEINNFYTPTVYEKGAEVVRMIHTLLGREGFRRGMDLYFKRHDGQAVTTDDFVQCMQDASGVDLAQFRRWYDQAGTPVLEVTDTYDPEVRELAVKQLELSDNMTDALAALTILANCDCDERIAALASFYAHWQHEPLVVDKWLRAQSSSRMPDALEAVQRLTGHPAFTLRNPNKVYALLGGFALANHVRFHATDGRGYDFMAGQIIDLDRLNPQVASRLARAFDRWRHFEPGRRAHAQTALERIAGTDGLSRDVLEVVTKALA